MTHPYRIQQLVTTTSTNDDAKKAAEAGEAEGLAVWALKQTAGRGRHGRMWESPEGNLHASLLLRPNCDAKHSGHYSLMASLAVYEMVCALLPQTKVTLKWPNDVLAQGKKISGILLEAAPVKNNLIEWLVIGVGLNVDKHPDNALYPTTSLRAHSKVLPPLKSILELLLERIFYWKNIMENHGFSEILDAWLVVAQTGPLTVRLPDQTIEGDFAGLDTNGNLLLHKKDGEHQTISAGDVLAS